MKMSISDDTIVLGIEKALKSFYTSVSFVL